MDTKESPLNRRDDEEPESSENAKPKKPKRTTIGVQFTNEIIDGMKEFCYYDDRPFGYLVRVACVEYIAKRRALQQALDAEENAKKK
jgi:hypothetical protein